MAVLPIRVQTIGGFQMTDAGGQDLTPRGAKTRGLLAILLLTPDRRRSRRWIETKLWSDRGPEQASGSLRQALTEIRRCLGEASDKLQADREHVALATDAFVVDLDYDPQAATAQINEGRELLEGLDVRDPEFESWLREQRSILETGLSTASQLTHSGTGNLATSPNQSGLISGALGATQAARFTLTLEPSSDGARVENLVALSLANQVGRLISEYAIVDIIAPGTAQAQLSPAQEGLRLRVDVIADDRQTNLLARLEAADRPQILWSNQASVRGTGPAIMEDAQFSRLAHNAAETALDLIPRLVESDSSLFRAEALTARAMREMFSFDGGRLRVADGMLNEAAQISPTPQLDAWRALVRMFMVVERTEVDNDELRREANEFARRALDEATGNAMVLAIVGKVRVLLDGDVAGGGALATDAVRLSPGNPIGLSGLATAMMRDGHCGEAVKLAERGRLIARNSPYVHWWGLFSCLAQIANGDFENAILSAEAVNARAPNFRAPLRHLYALYTHSGNLEGAAQVKERLSRFEPGFSLELIREDPTYPAGVLRSSPLIRLQDLV